MNRRDADMDEEVAEHVRRLTEANEAAGLDAREARRTALLAFGPIESFKEAARANRPAAWLSDVGRDVAFGARMLVRNPVFTIVLVLTLGLGIGANAAIFRLVNAVILRPLPVRDPGQLVLFQQPWGEGIVGGTPNPGRLRAYSYPLWQNLNGQSDALGFAGMLAQQSFGTVATVTRNGVPDTAVTPARGQSVSANYFAVLGVTPTLGRTFLPADETIPGGNPVVVLRHGYWQAHFGGDPRIVGDQVTINGTPYTVIGVAPPSFLGTTAGASMDFWVPLTMQVALTRFGSLLEKSDEYWLTVMGRLGPGASSDAAQTKLNVALQRFWANDPAFARDLEKRRSVRIELEPGGTGLSPLRREFRDPLVTLMAGVGLLLLIVCLNVAHLLFVRTTGRQAELAVRVAMGATRGRVVRQFLTESVLLALMGTVAGALLSNWMSAALVSLAFQGGSLPSFDVGIDRAVLSFTAVVALMTALLVGLLPAWQAARAVQHVGLKAAAPTIGGSGKARLVTRVLLVSQVACSLVLVVAAGLLAGSFNKLRDVNKGFDEEQTLLVGINPQAAGLTGAQGVLLSDHLVERLRGLPGVRSASLSGIALLEGGGRARTTDAISLPAGSTHQRMVVRIGIVTPGYFETMGMSLARGRGFTRGDQFGGPLVAVVNETLARAFAGEALGQHLLYEERHDTEVVGVVRNARINGLRHEPEPMMYLPVAQTREFLQSVEIRASGDPALLGKSVHRAVRESHPTLPVVSVRTMRDQVDRSIRQERLLSTLSSAFGIAALFLVSLGLYGVMAQWAGQRTREIGVRVALGATARGVRWMVLRHAFVLVLGGLALGLPAAIGVSRLLEAMLFGMSPADPRTLALATLVMFAIAALAAYIPARRASRAEPMVSLRAE